MAVVKCESSKDRPPEVIETIAVKIHYLIDFSKQKDPNGSALYKEGTLKRTKALIVPWGEYTVTWSATLASTRNSCQLKISSSTPNIQKHHIIATFATNTNCWCLWTNIIAEKPYFLFNRKFLCKNVFENIFRFSFSYY